jgi:soluble lytic murein transglycosylase-like protein
MIRVLGAALALSVSASTASAELVFFTTGGSLSVKSHRQEGQSLVLNLRAGGQVICDSSVIVRIAPDEVPYPEPEPPAAAEAEGPEAAAYTEIIDTIAKEQGVSPRLVKAIIRVESAYQPRARSRKGAMGLMQLMPETARQYAVADPYDPRANIEAGIKHLKSLLQRFPLDLALAAYNAGEAAVQRFGGVPPYAETRGYVSAILNLLGSQAKLIGKP